MVLFPAIPSGMNTAPYTIIKHYRGQYQVLDPNGKDMLGQYVSQHEAQQTVIAHKLQDKALKHPGLLRMGEVLTTMSGYDLEMWLYNFLIRMDIPDMRLLMQRPSRLKEMKRKNDESRASSLLRMPE